MNKSFGQSSQRKNSVQQSNTNAKNGKPQLQKKWKDRVNSSAIHDRPPSSQRAESVKEKHNQFEDSFYQEYKKGPKIMFGRSSQIKANRLIDQQDFSKTASKLFDANFKHHNPELCVCSDCQCGRHLCKLHAIGPNMSKGTVYQQSFTKKNNIPNIVNHDKEYPKNQGPHLQMNSTQRKDFIGKKGDDLERPHPQDLLKSGGPAPLLTSYTAGFQVIGETINTLNLLTSITEEIIHLKEEAHIETHLDHTQPDLPVLQKNPDNFKHGQPWLGDTTYKNFFQNPNKEDYAKKVKIIEKLQIDPNFKNQYQTTYKNDFLGIGPTVCPAKIRLEGLVKGMMSTKKAKFSQNMDYKSLSPDFHALSLSKQTFV